MGVLIWLVEGGVDGVKNGWWSLKATFGHERTSRLGKNNSVPLATVCYFRGHRLCRRTE